MHNPKAALAAYTAPAFVQVGPFKVRDITLGLGGILERIESPVFTGRKPTHVSGWIPTLFAMTRPTEDSERLLVVGIEAFNAAAKKWADEDVPYGLTARLVQAINDSVHRLNAISGESDDESRAEKNGLADGPTGG